MRRDVWYGLGLLLVGAILQQPLGAQVRDTIPKRRDSTTLVIPVPPGADSLLRDSLARRDSITRMRLRDTIKAPVAHAERPPDIGTGQILRWNRDSIYTTGAITLADLLERVPGVTVLHAGWISAPANAAYLGDVRQVRVFVDGFEMPVLDPRSGGAMDLTQVPIWNAEEVILERAPEEIRVHILTWRVRNTTPVTRTDVSTGDQQTNLYRGYFGRRYGNGAVLQAGAQQFGTTPPQIFGNSADQLGLMARAGWAGRNWSIDAYATHTGRHRGVIIGDRPLDAGDQPMDSIPTLESGRTDAYLRIGTGDPDSSPAWAQVLAVGSVYRYTGVRTFANIVPTTPEDSALLVSSLDTSVSRMQYVATAGVNRGPFRFSTTGRLYAGAGHRLFVPALRASFAMKALTLSARAEGKSIDSVARTDLTAQLTPLPFVSLIAGAGIATNHQIADSAFTTKYARAEAGVRLGQLWFLGGVLWRDGARLPAPIVFDTLFDAHQSASATALTAGIRGQLWRSVYVDLSAVRWNDTAGFYRPRYQTRSEVFVRTNLLRQFPSGNFGLKFSIAHEYRSGVHFPIRGVPDLTAPGYRTISTLLEIRILSATLSWQFRNVLGARYSQVPFFIMPRQTNFYGVRWDFFN